eukprot:2437649-Pleurochrysis_carterae.AAC.1
MPTPEIKSRMCQSEPKSLFQIASDIIAAKQPLVESDAFSQNTFARRGLSRVRSFRTIAHKPIGSPSFLATESDAWKERGWGSACSCARV